MTTQPPLTERPAERGELCTCGRPAVVVYPGGPLGDTGWCGAQSIRTDCAWCDQPRHSGRGPEYRLRPATDAREQLVWRAP